MSGGRGGSVGSSDLVCLYRLEMSIPGRTYIEYLEEAMGG